MGRNVCLRPCPLRTHFFGGYKCRSLHSTLMGREVCLRPCPLRTHFFDGDRTQKFAQHLDGKGSVLCSFVTLELRGCFDVRRHWTRVKIRGVWSLAALCHTPQKHTFITSAGSCHVMCVWCNCHVMWCDVCVCDVCVLPCDVCVVYVSCHVMCVCGVCVSVCCKLETSTLNSSTICTNNIKWPVLRYTFQSSYNAA